MVVLIFAYKEQAAGLSLFISFSDVSWFTIFQCHAGRFTRWPLASSIIESWKAVLIQHPKKKKIIYFSSEGLLLALGT